MAIKVQYPEIADALEADLDVASVLIGLGRAIAPGLDPRVVAGELRERVLEELDFELEAQQSMHRLGRFNTDPHPGNYLLLPGGRLAFLDFGNTVEVRQGDVGLAALKATVDSDADGLAEAASELGYVRDLDRLDREALLAQARALGDRYLVDRELRVDPDYVASVVAAMIDPRRSRVRCG